MSEELLYPKTENLLNESTISDNSMALNTNENSFNDFVTPTNNMLIGNEVRHSFTNQFTNIQERDANWFITIDHCYARPWNWRPDINFLRPTKTLFIKKPITNKKKSVNPLAPVQDVDEVIDIETIPEETTPIYDKVKAKAMMEECEKQAQMAKTEDRKENWEEHVLRYNCTTATQHRLLRGMLQILDNDHLARLAFQDRSHEPIARRAIIDKSVERVRRLMATASWDPKYTQWLHQILIDNLSTDYLASYLDILQTLKSKLPTFVDKMMSASHTNRSALSYECLFPLLKKPWDPVASSLQQDKPKKLPGNPIIVFVPSTSIASKRILKWITLLSNLATVVTIPPNYGGTGQKTTMTNFVDQMFVMTRSKLHDIRSDYPGRPIVLLGFNFGASLALQLAQVEQVVCVICLGFSLLTAEGRRGDPEDNLLELQCPVLFVVGQNSNTSFQEDMEDMRERMRVETGLIVVGSADDNLRISKKLKKSEGITQSVVDRCIADEIGEFISGIVLSPYPPHIRQSPTDLTMDNKKTKTERKRYNSNTSSLDSEPPSPTPKNHRPGQKNNTNFGRPPGSKSKAKWTTQGIPSSPNNSSPPPVASTSTPDITINDTSTTDKTLTNETLSPPKKLKTLKPTISLPADKTNATGITSIKTTGKTLNFQNRTLSGLLQGDIPIQTAKPPPSGLKVLENVKLSSAGQPKFLPNIGRTFDMSKISVINSTPGKSSNSIVLLPDGKIKKIPSSLKDPSARRYITSKKQLLTAKTSKSIKKLSYVSPMNQINSIQPSPLPPPTNLTTQDIMDLPIIFADDNQILDNAAATITAQPEVKPITQIITTQQPKILATTSANKFVLINKQIPLQPASNFIIPTANNSKRINPNQSLKAPPKYTKIILSSKKPCEDGTIKPTVLTPPGARILKPIIDPQIKKPSPTDSSSMEIIDLENEIAASTVYKTQSTGDVIVSSTINNTNIADVATDLSSKSDINKKRSVSDEDIDDGPPEKIAKVEN